MSREKVKKHIGIPDIIDRKTVPQPWAEGDNIPWSEPGFSRRMLAEHLSQAHNMASRRFEAIDVHVKWIHSKLLKAKRSKILDLGCGPGLYTSRLAELGHKCFGIDYSPASIKYAIEQNEKEALGCKYLQADIREADFGTGFDLAMLVFGELNIFRPADAGTILKKINHALSTDGILILEPHSFSAVENIGRQPSSWYSAKSGLFSDKPHICLEENFWDEQDLTATKRYFVIDASSSNVSHYAATYQAYTDRQYRDMLSECGFEAIEFYPSMGQAQDKSQDGLIAIVAKRKDSKNVR
jgi:SAM-dependent methyltransferase